MYVSVAYTLSDMGAAIGATLAQDSSISCLQVASYSISVVSSELHSSDRTGRQGKMDLRLSLNSGLRSITKFQPRELSIPVKILRPQSML